MPGKVALEKVKAVKRKHSADLLRRPGVCGVDIEVDKAGNGSLAIHLDTNDPKVKAGLPDVLDGVPVEYVYTGPIRKQ
jgi:hypothetical protein